MSRITPGIIPIRTAATDMARKSEDSLIILPLLNWPNTTNLLTRKDVTVPMKAAITNDQTLDTPCSLNKNTTPKSTKNGKMENVPYKRARRTINKFLS